jgi:hypothetical protein
MIYSIHSITTDTSDVISDLCKIGMKYQSDKCPYSEYTVSGHKHPYTAIYDSWFSSLRYRDINVAEIGIERNDSIQLWRDYFPSATIYGFEFIQEKIDFAKSQNLKNVHYEFMNVREKQSIIDSFNKMDVKYDIIIDDSTHIIEDQIRIIQFSVEYLNPGGILVVEDISRDVNENDYSIPLQNVLKYFSISQFVTTDHNLRFSEGWNNDKLLMLVRNNLPFQQEVEVPISSNSKIFIVTPSRRPFNLEFIAGTVPQECEWVVVFDKTVKNEHNVSNATVIQSN